MADQAESLRQIVDSKVDKKTADATVASVMGLHNSINAREFIANFAISLSSLGKRVLLIDLDDDSADLLDMLEIMRCETLEMLVAGKRIEEIARRGRGGINIITGGNALWDIISSSLGVFKKAEQKLVSHCREYDCIFMIISTKSEYALRAQSVLKQSDVCLLLTQLVPECIVGTFKLISTNKLALSSRLIFGGDETEQAKMTSVNFQSIVKKTEGISPSVLGWIGTDEEMLKSKADGEPFVDQYPDCQATKRFLAMANEYIQNSAHSTSGMEGFMERIRNDRHAVLVRD